MKITRIISILIVCSAVAVTAMAQDPWIDSVKKSVGAQQEDTSKVWSLLALCDAYSLTFPDTAFNYGQQAYLLSEKLNFDNGRLWSLININKALFVQGNYTLELEYAFKLIPLAERMNSIYATGYSNGTVGDSYLNLGEYNTALKYYKNVLNLAEKNSLPELHRMYSGLAPIYVGLHQFDSALYYAKKGYAIFKTSTYFNANDWNTKWSLSLAYTTLGSAFASKGIVDSALLYYRMSLPVSEEINMSINKISAYNGLATLFNLLSKYDSAKWYARKTLFETGPLINPSGKQKAASLLAEIYEKEHNADSSLKYLHLAIQLKDSLYDHQKMMAFQNMLNRQDEKDRAVKSATTALQNRYRLYFIITGFLILFAVGFFLLRNRRVNQLQTIRNGIANDLHDDIGSTLSSISIMNELAKAKSPEALSLLTSIGENTAAIQENMSDLVWTVNANNDHFENMLHRMNLFATEITDAKNIQLEFASDTSLHSSKLTMKQRKNVYLFFKEAVNNAAKHANAKKIIVNLNKNNHYIEMNILDDGFGFNTTENYNGNGMSSLKKRAEEINGTCNIISQAGKGTSVQLKFKMA